MKENNIQPYPFEGNNIQPYPFEGNNIQPYPYERKTFLKRLKTKIYR